MKTLTFTALDGTTKTGEYWSPGPRPRTVWLLVDGGGTAAVHKDKGTEIVPPADPRFVERRGCRCTRLLGFKECSQDCAAVAQDWARNEYLSGFRYAPAPILARETARAVALFDLGV
ncbi:hypothetical protein EV193_104338 [Herbihabitans rhizosphaerae]|uniref:Uncharacterized protein n=1 Tax=Herbihabitans rhizosphaerae TaxID=1872711 RepID=A0A4Q7KRI6_9PSEU|nr:hypothetical protein [Herbihabitans rhizosphaerae]RZS39124.1 hypothetical protein EV193_104338 [Herbihabitans rhizosphaerae]